jgi:flavin-dependent dehydrogenase
MPSRRNQRASSGGGSGLKLENGSRVAVIGGGPAGSFFSYFLLRMGQRLGRQLHVDVFEPRDFSQPGPRGCNMCGGIVSESLVQHLASEGINLPSSIIQRRIDSYFLHTDVGSVRIPTPLQEKRIASVHRGAGPRTFTSLNPSNFDGYLLQMAEQAGARHVPERVTGLDWRNGRPRVGTGSDEGIEYDLLVGAVGVNSPALSLFQTPETAYEPPTSTKAYIAEFYLGADIVKRYLEDSMHVFLLDLPRLEFAALIPKSNYVTLCLLGQDIDKSLAHDFLETEAVRECMPPLWEPPKDFCHCSARINVGGAVRPFADRLVFVGDCATTKLYKDGVGSAYRTAKAAAFTAVFKGISAREFQRHYLPACRTIQADNRIGRLVFAITRQIRMRKYARRSVWKMVTEEQHKEGARRHMSLALWDIFTGSASYRSVLWRTLHPVFLGRFARRLAASKWRPEPRPRRRKIHMATGASGALGKKYTDGEIVYRQGDPGDRMYVVQHGKVEVIRREGNKEFCIAELSDGDFFGEMAMFEQETRPATVRAVGEVWVYTLERDSLIRRIHEDPSLAFRLIQKMSYRIRELETSLIRTTDAAM